MSQMPRLITRVGSFGLAAVILLLAALALLVTTVTQRAADRITQVTQQIALYQVASSAARAESSLQLEYWAEQSADPTLLHQFYLEAGAATAALQQLRRVGESDDRATAAQVLAEQRRYLSLSSIFFNEVRRGDQGRANALENSLLGPLSSHLGHQVSVALVAERQQSAHMVDGLGPAAASIRAITIVVFGLGLFLLGAFSWVFRRYRLSMRDEETNHRTLLEQLPVAAYFGSVDDTASTTYISREIEAMLGYSRDEWIANAHLWPTLLHPDDRERVLANHLHHLRSRERFVAEYRLIARSGRQVWVRDEAVIVESEGGKEAAKHGVLIDITDQKRAEAALEHQALHDALTQLPNRTLLHDRLQQAILSTKRRGSSLALLLMDLDRFKEVNDTFGHHYGDLLLQEIGGQLRGALRDSDTVARLGGDEFAILLPSATAMGASVAARKILRALKGPFVIEDQSLDVGASIGIALYPEHGEDANALLQRADVAMYTAKRAGGEFAVYQADQDPYSPNRLSLIRDLRYAIDHDELILHYQPKAHFKTGCAQHVEALVRWHHPERGVVRPDEFIPLAEHAGLIHTLSIWVLNESLQQIHGWHNEGIDVSVAVNLSPRTLHEPDLVDVVAELLQTWQVSPQWLQLEITEGALMVDPIRAMDTLTRLHTMGVWISIDDFGTGYSSLGYLKRLPADQIKIDKSFVMDMVTDEDDAFIVRSVIDLGHSLGLEVVAEGVENAETWNLLRDMGCDMAQGYHLSRPLPPAQIAEWMRQEQIPLSDVS